MRPADGRSRSRRPSGLTIDGSSSGHSRRHARLCAAKASLSSTRRRSAQSIPARRSAVGRPRPVRCRRGEVRRRSWPRRRCERAARDRVRAGLPRDVTSSGRRAVVHRGRVAGGDGAAVGAEHGRSAASFSIVVSARMHSSRSRSTPSTANDLVVEAARRPTPRRPAGAIRGRTHPARLATMEYLSASSSAPSPSDTVHCVGHLRIGHPPAERRAPQLLVTGGVRPCGLLQHPRRARHALDAAGDHDVGVADGHRAAGAEHGVETRSAQPVHGGARERRRQTRQQHRHPGDVAVVLARLVGVAEV